MTLTKSGIREIADELEAEVAGEDAASYRPRYNVAPTDTHWILERAADHRVLLPGVWGYVTATGRPLINVRGEQVGSGSGFRHAFAERRCAIVTDGFYEWTKDHRPFWFHREGGGLILLAGLYQDAGAAAGVARPGATVARPRFTILTTRPNHVVSAVHDRMPVVLPPDAIDDWLAGPAARAARLIATAPEDALVVTPVSKRVRSVKNDDPECLVRISDDPRRGEQRSLF